MWSDLWSRKCFALLSTEKLCDSLLQTCFMWGFHVIFLSIITHRNVFSCTLAMLTPSICIIAWVFILQFPNNMNLILFKFKDNLFQSNHLFNLHISSVIHPRSSCKFFPEQNMFVSSANSTNFNILEIWTPQQMAERLHQNYRVDLNPWPQLQ